MRFSELIKKLEQAGWYELRTGKGSCRIYVHPTKPGKIPVHVHPGQEVKKGTANAILKQAGLK